MISCSFPVLLLAGAGILAFLPEIGLIIASIIAKVNKNYFHFELIFSVNYFILYSVDEINFFLEERLQ